MYLQIIFATTLAHFVNCFVITLTAFKYNTHIGHAWGEACFVWGSAHLLSYTWYGHRIGRIPAQFVEWSGSSVYGRYSLTTSTSLHAGQVWLPCMRILICLGSILFLSLERCEWPLFHELQALKIEWCYIVLWYIFLYICYFLGLSYIYL